MDTTKHISNEHPETNRCRNAAIKQDIETLCRKYAIDASDLKEIIEEVYLRPREEMLREKAEELRRFVREKLREDAGRDS